MSRGLLTEPCPPLLPNLPTSTSRKEIRSKRSRGSLVKIPLPLSPNPPPVLNILPPETIDLDQDLKTILAQTSEVETALEARKIWMANFSHIKITGFFNQGGEGILYYCSMPEKNEQSVVKLARVVY
jgi:hypothetical protein